MSKGAQIIQGPVAFAVWYRVRNIIWIVSLTPPWNPPLFPIALNPKARLLALTCVSLASIYHLELHELPAASQMHSCLLPLHLHLHLHLHLLLLWRDYHFPLLILPPMPPSKPSSAAIP